MDRLTLTLVVESESDSEEFAPRAAAALRHLADLTEFREGSYEPGYAVTCPNGVKIRADYAIEEGVNG